MKSIVVFYSHSGNTRKGAKLIQELTGADLLELKPKKTYPTDLWETVDIFKKELQENTRVELLLFDFDIDAYDTVYIGTPNWGNTVATPLLTFFDCFDLSGKKVMPFVTHGGGGVGDCGKNIIKYASAQQTVKPLVYSGSRIERQTVKNWLEG